MKMVRIVPMFRRNAEIECYIPQLTDFTLEEEIDILNRIDKVIPNKKWAFVQKCIPQNYTGVLIAQNSPTERIRQLRDLQCDIVGYNFEVKVGVKELLAHCNAVAVDINYPQCDQIVTLLSVYGDEKTKKIALCVNNPRDFENYKQEGFDFFIGDFYTKAVYSKGKEVQKVNPLKTTKLAIFSEMQNWEKENSNQDMGKISNIIQRDVSLTMSLIKLSNSAFFGAKNKTTNLKEALVRLGTTNITKWVTAILAADMADEDSPEIARVALLRAKFMENVAAITNANHWLAFFTGLASVSGVLLGVSREQALKDMNAPAEIALFLSYQKDVGRIYGIVEAYISANRERLDYFIHGDVALVDRLYVAYVNAELWVADILGNLDSIN